MGMYNRRRFLKTTAVAAGMVELGSIMPLASAIGADKKNSTSPVINGGKPVFRFLQVNDQHVQSYHGHYVPRNDQVLGPNWYGDTNRRSLWLLEALEEGKFFADIDFLLIADDMIVGNRLESIKRDLEFFDKHFLRYLPVPFYPVMGNHENGQDEGIPESEVYYRQFFGENKSDYQFTHKGIQFIAFNNSGSAQMKNRQRITERKEKVKSMLEDHPSLPKILCCHIPLIPVRHEETLAKSFRFPGYKTMEPEILQLVEQHKDKVLAVLSGHVHLSGVINYQSIFHIVVSGLASFPHDVVLYSVFSDRIEVEFMQIPSDLWETKSNLHGIARLGRDFTDENHPDNLSYIMGNASERRFSIPMK
jgi:Icc-related predicted phosphoesterase